MEIVLYLSYSDSPDLLLKYNTMTINNNNLEAPSNYIKSLVVTPLISAGCIKLLEDVPSAVFKIGDLLAVIMDRKGDMSRADTISRILPLVCSF